MRRVRGGFGEVEVTWSELGIQNTRLRGRPRRGEWTAVAAPGDQQRPISALFRPGRANSLVPGSTCGVLYSLYCRPVLAGHGSSAGGTSFGHGRSAARSGVCVASLPYTALRRAHGLGVHVALASRCSGRLVFGDGFDDEDDGEFHDVVFFGVMEDDAS